MESEEKVIAYTKHHMMHSTFENHKLSAEECDKKLDEVVPDMSGRWRIGSNGPTTNKSGLRILLAVAANVRATRRSMLRTTRRLRRRRATAKVGRRAKSAMMS